MQLSMLQMKLLKIIVFKLQKILDRYIEVEIILRFFIQNVKDRKRVLFGKKISTISKRESNRMKY